MEGSLRRSRLDLWLALLLGGAAFALYAVTLAPTVLEGDAGEFQFVPYLLGVAHPTGYPLYTLLGWLWSHLVAVGDVAYRMNLFSAFWAALAVALLYPTARIMLQQVFPLLPESLRRLIAIVAATVLAVTPTLWSQAVIAEVYGLHLFLTVLIFYFLLAWGIRGRSRLLLFAALAFGLSLAHHSTTLLLAPAILSYLWLAERRVFREPRLLFQALLLVLFPLLLYLYIPWRAPHTPYLRLPLTAGRELVLYENTWTSLVDFVLGGPFRGSVDLSVSLVERLSMSWGLLRNEFGWIGVALAVVGVAQLVFGRSLSGTGKRWALLALTGLTYAAFVAFNLVYTIGDIFVMYIPSYLIVVLWLALGVGTVASLVARQRVAGVLVVLLFLALPLWMAFGNYARVDQSGNDLARTHWEAILAEPLPANSVLVSNDRNEFMPMWYFQYVDGQRPDLLGLFPLITPDYPTLGHVLDLALSTGRPVYLIKGMPGIEAKVDVEAEGQLWRVLGPSIQKEPDTVRNIHLDDALLLTGYDRLPHSPGPGETLQVRLYWEAVRSLAAEYHSFVHLLDFEGGAISHSDRQPGGVYYPTTLWRVGERLRDDHLLRIPGDLPEGVYSLLAGMYALSGDGALQPLGEPVIIGQVAVKADVPTEPGAWGQPVGARFGDEIELLSYDAQTQAGRLEVTLQWQALAAPGADYTVFVHLLDAGDQVIAQHDSGPRDGSYPTSVWDVDEVVTDPHLLSLPADLAKDQVRLQVGLYVLETGQRLQVEGNGDAVELGPIKVGD
jgi:hypothetical protein